MKTIPNTKHGRNTIDDFEAVILKLASPDRIREWSHGEVTKPETMNYRTQRSEKNGLFDEKIFGPERDYECYCGKYKGIRYKGIVCEKCGVELTRSIVRRERMGHIELCVPVAHIWYLRTMPSRVATVLGMSAADIEKVVYFAGYLITKVNKEQKEALLKELDSEYKNKVKTLQDEKSKEALKTFSVASAIVGAGGIGNITPDIIKGVATNLEKQYQYFDRFSDKKLGLTTGINTTGAADHRISTKNITALRNYASSIKGTYEMAEAQVLSDGEYEVEERRVITAAESCVSCVTYASEGWVEFGSLGEIGDSECGSRCKCYFEYRDRKKKK